MFKLLNHLTFTYNSFADSHCWIHFIWPNTLRLQTSTTRCIVYATLFIRRLPLLDGFYMPHSFAHTFKERNSTQPASALLVVFFNLGTQFLGLWCVFLGSSKQIISVCPIYPHNSQTLPEGVPLHLPFNLGHWALKCPFLS